MRLAAALALAALPAAAPAQVSEEVVRFASEGQEVVGTLRLPEGEPAPVVLLLHGFTGSRDEMAIPGTDEGVFSRAARLLAEEGYASLRIDFRGSGESTADLSFADTTFERQVADALAAIEHLRSLDTVQADEMHLIGWSQGGLVATAAAGRSGAFDAVALWAAVAEPEATYGGFLGAETVEAGMAAGPDETVAVPLPWGGEIELKGAFFDGITAFDPQAEIAAWEGPLFVAHGSEDTVVPPSAADRLLAAHEGPEELWTAEMDHAFDVTETTETLDAMVGATVAFFEEHDD